MSERTSSEIQRDIERTRAEMGHTIDTIQERLSPGQLVDQFLRGSGGRTMAHGANEFAVNLGRAVRENPLPLLLIGTGIAWLMLSGGRRRYDRELYEPYDVYDEEAWAAQYGSTEEAAERYDQRMRVRQEGAASDPAYAGHYGAAAGGATASPYRTTAGSTRPSDPTAERPGVSGSTVGAAAVNPGGTTPSGAAGEGPQSASERARQAAAEARERAVHASAGPEYTTHTAGPASTDEGTQQGLNESGGDWRSKGRERFEHAGESARQSMGRASAGARERARRAQHQARRGARRAGGAFSRLFHDQPLLVGAIGIAIGAAIGALIPVSRREDEWLGEASDELKHRAREEAGRARRIVERTVEAAREEAVRQGLTPEGIKEEMQKARRAAQQAAGEKVRETQRDMEESIKRTAEEKLHESEQEAEGAFKAKAEDAEDRFRKVGEAAKQAAKEEAKHESSGDASRRGSSS